MLRLRLILCETDQSDLQLQTKCPGADYRLPSELKSTTGPSSKGLTQVIGSDPDTEDAEARRQQAQIVSLLDRPLFVMRLSASNKEVKIAQLAKLDGEIRTFLEVVAGELDRRQNAVCSHVTVCHR